jgi:WhiB family redox-sensing transcriptional regulator
MWIQRAACRTGASSLNFFPAEGEPISPEVAACCAGCQVSDECRRYAEHCANVSGVWGGELWEDGLRRR